MTDTEIRFTDGASYERMMGRWSALVGTAFLDWLDAPLDARWLDVGCGNGAFTQQVIERARPAQVQAFDPSPQQIAYARTRLSAEAPVRWGVGDAMRLPVADADSDVAVMALVLFFVPDPAVGVAEMCRAVRPGGLVAAYHWDMLNGGFPLADIGAEIQKAGVPPMMPPSVQVATLEASATLWRAAGLQQVRTTQITVQRRFADFDDYWDSAATSNAMRPMFDAFGAEQLAVVKANVRARLQAGAGPLTVSARANAVCGVRA